MNKMRKSLLSYWRDILYKYYFWEFVNAERQRRNFFRQNEEKIFSSSDSDFFQICLRCFLCWVLNALTNGEAANRADDRVSGCSVEGISCIISFLLRIGLWWTLNALLHRRRRCFLVSSFCDHLFPPRSKCKAQSIGVNLILLYILGSHFPPRWFLFYLGGGWWMGLHIFGLRFSV